MIAIIPHKMFSLCKQSLKYNRRIMWNWKTSAPGINFFLKLIAHVHDTTYQIENFIRLILRMSRFLVTMHVFCFNFNTFLKTSSLFFTLHATYRYIQINIKKNPDETQKHMLCYLKKTISCLILYRHLINTNTSNNN